MMIAYTVPLSEVVDSGFFEYLNTINYNGQQMETIDRWKNNLLKEHKKMVLYARDGKYYGWDYADKQSPTMESEHCQYEGHFNLEMFTEEYIHEHFPELFV